MGEPAVVALVVVLDRHLPVRLGREPAALQRSHPFDGGQELVDRLPNARIDHLHGGRVAIKVHEEEAPQVFGRNLGEADSVRIESRASCRVRCVVETPVQAIGPGVVGADQLGAGAAAFEQAVTAVHADVVEGADRPFEIPDREEGLPGDLERNVAPGLADIRPMAGVLPGRRQHAALLAAEQVPVQIRGWIHDPLGSGVGGGVSGFHGPASSTRRDRISVDA